MKLFFFKANSKIIYSVNWSGCGRYLITSEYGGVIKVFDTKNFSLLHKFGKYDENERVIFFDLIFFKAWTAGVDMSKGSKTGN